MSIQDFIKKSIPKEDLLGIIHYNNEVIIADRHGKSPYDFNTVAIKEVTDIKNKIDNKK